MFKKIIKKETLLNIFQVNSIIWLISFFWFFIGIFLGLFYNAYAFAQSLLCLIFLLFLGVRFNMFKRFRYMISIINNNLHPIYKQYNIVDKEEFNKLMDSDFQNHVRIKSYRHYTYFGNEYLLICHRDNLYLIKYNEIISITPHKNEIYQNFSHYKDIFGFFIKTQKYKKALTVVFDNEIEFERFYEEINLKITKSTT